MDGLRPFQLLGSLTAEQLWPLTNLALLGWVPLAVAPRWKHTMKASLIPPLLHAAIYVGGIFSLIVFSGDDESMDFGSLQGVATGFKDPNVVFVGWIHYLVFDLLVGRMIVKDSIERGASLKFHALAIVPCLFFTLMLGPTGWLGYMVLRSVFLPSPSLDDDDSPGENQSLL